MRIIKLAFPRHNISPMQDEVSFHRVLHERQQVWRSAAAPPFMRHAMRADTSHYYHRQPELSSFHYGLSPPCE